MANVKDLTGFPPAIINAYLQDQFKYFELIPSNYNTSVFFPVVPTNIDEMYDNNMTAPGYSPLMIIYDRMLRMNPSQFYMRNREQTVYSVHSTSLEQVHAASRVLSEALDRSDAAAQDVNAWASNKAKSAEGLLGPDGLPMNLNVYFHNFRVYQVNETKDVLDLVSVKTIFVNKIIVEYDYHVVGSYYN